MLQSLLDRVSRFFDSLGLRNVIFLCDLRRDPTRSIYHFIVTYLYPCMINATAR
jgi:hypothetical protein